MKNNYILIDYENVQPTQLDALKDRNFKVIVFVGNKQVRIPFELASSMQVLGSNAEYIKIEGNGPNALDFHIAFYIGKITERDSNAYFHIISKDTGFDPLIKHLRDQKMLAQRVADIGEITSLQSSITLSPENKITAIITRLTTMKNNKPRKLEGLKNTINSVFSKKLSETEVASLIKVLKAKKLIALEGEKIIYS